MEFSKKWLIISGCFSIILTVAFILNLVSEGIVLAGYAEVSIASGFYYWKARTENRAKYTQKFITNLSKKDGIDAALRAAEITLRE